MSARINKGLGKGLSALIGGETSDKPTASELESVSVSGYQELSIDQVEANPMQPRTIFHDESLEELAESIKAVGLVQPVIVRKTGDRYELVAGERRWRAARLAGLVKIPAVIRDAGDAEALELALIENINREDLNAIDTARAYANLQEEFGSTQVELAQKLGRSRSAIANTIRLLELPDDVQALIETGKLSEGHGRALLSISDRLKQKKLATLIASKGLSVRQTEALVKHELSEKRSEQAPVFSVNQELMDEAINAFYSTFQLPAKVRWKGKAGKIELAFSSEDQLARAIELLSDTEK